MIEFPLDNLTRATFRLAEFGFFGFIMKIWVQTPFFCGQLSRSGDFGGFNFWGFFRRIA